MASATSAIPQEVQDKLKHQFLVVRQQAIENLVTPLKDGDTSNLAAFQAFAFSLLEADSWQSKQSAFILCEKLAPFSKPDFIAAVLKSADAHFEFKEHRVRDAIADCLGACANVGGLDVYLTVKDKLLTLISDNFSRDEDDATQDASGAASLEKLLDKKLKNSKSFAGVRVDGDDDVPDAGHDDEVHVSKAKAHDHDHHDHAHGDCKDDDGDSAMADAKPKEKKQRRGSFSVEELQHDTEGWKCLFSAMKTVQRMMVGLGRRFEPEITPALLLLLRRSTRHINRFVREMAYHSYAAICLAMSYEFMTEKKLGDELADIIYQGLSDNWSQVRYASSHAVRNFFALIPCDADVDEFDNPRKKHFFPKLLPPMCINRYYVAAGVRVYSLESWKLLVGTNGRRFVAEYMPYVQKFFIKQAGADNHAVREAACHCIAELATKVEHDAVSEFIPGLLDALIGCFKDASWPVRDAACVALGDFVSQFPDESVADLDELYNLWLEHLSDNIPSVREDSAIAFGKILRCPKLAKEHGAEKRAVEHIKKYIHSVAKQKADVKKYDPNANGVANAKFGGYENTTVFGVAARRVRDNDSDLHANQQVYSCGSLAPKLKRATRSGCMDHGFSRDREMWEYTDGCVHLLRELVAALPTSQYFDQFVPSTLPQIAGKRDFAHFHELQQTVWKSIPAMGRAVGKRKFKMYLELLLVPMIETLECKNRLAMNAAGQCITFCNTFIGSKFFIPRLKPDQLQVVQSSQFVQL